MHLNKKALVLIVVGILSLLAFTSCTQVSEWSDNTFSNTEWISTTGSAALQIVVAIIMLVSLFSLILPVIPGITFIWLSALIYGVVTGFDKTSGMLMGIITGLMLLGNTVDNLLMGAGARKGGAPWLTTIATVVAALVGSAAFPPFGGFVAAVIVMFTLEVIRLKDSERAMRSTGELLKGFGLSFLARFFIGLIMIALWIVWLVQTGQWLL